MTPRSIRPTPAPLRVAVPAKINLHLRVGPPTADGFHPLGSWMVTVGLFDNLEFTLTPTPGVHLTCDDPALPTDASNLVVKCAQALLEESGHAPSTGVDIHLRKQIPSGAGLGGGSADGAFTLLALNHLLDLRWPPDRLAGIASRFGSDLAFFCHGPSSVCTGRGEIVHPIPPPAARHAVLILPPIHMPTPAVYRRFDELLTAGLLTSVGKSPADTRYADWPVLTAQELLPHLINDLEPPAFSLSKPLTDLHSGATKILGGRIVRMSGSGSTLFTLYDTRDEAETNAAQLRLTLGVNVQAVELAPALREMSTPDARSMTKGD
jgi:4-diphosphocytidyl-2-C-methyl-D-erythritol kinase